MKFTSIQSHFFTDLIERIWIVENNSKVEKCIIIPPNQYTNLSFPLNNGGYFLNEKYIDTVHVEGISFRPTLIKYPAKSKIIGVRFYPAAFYVFSDLSIRETINASIHFNSKHLAPTLEQSDKLQPKLDEFFQQLLSPLFSSKKHEQTELMRRFYWNFRNSEEHLSIKNFIKQHRTNYSTLNRLSHKTLGTSPSQLVKLLKFRRSLCHLIDTDKNLTSISFDAGYFDQSHFIREFKLFLNCKPSAYNEYINSAKNSNITTNYNFRKFPN